MDTTNSRIQVRPFEDRSDYEAMVDYFLNADASFLKGMGADPTKLPPRDTWIEAAMLNHSRADEDKDWFYLAWICEGVLVGHSGINKIKFGEEASIHLHLWVSGMRKAGLGTRFFESSAAEFMRLFKLKRLYCEPFAENPAPNRVLRKLGFRFVKRYRTTPGVINFEQDVNRYVLDSSPNVAG